MLPPFGMLEFNSQTANVSGGCQSATISTDNPNRNQGPLAAPGAAPSSELLSWDGASITGHRDYVVLQFTDIIGSGPNQLRPHEQIQRATLRYYVDTNFSAFAVGATSQLHEISIPWDANLTTFRTFVGAQGLNEAEYRTPAITTAFADRAGWFEIDVTASVQSWVALSLIHISEPTRPY